LVQQVPLDRELEVQLHTMNPVSRDRVAVPGVRRREHAASPVHTDMQFGLVRSSESNTQRVGAVCLDMVQVEPYLSCRWHHFVPILPAKQTWCILVKLYYISFVNMYKEVLTTNEH
jgi:hypothetical protein